MEFDNKEQIISLFDSVGFAVLILDNTLCYTYVNNKLLELLQTSKEKLLGKKISDIYPSVLQTKFGKHLLRTLKTGKPQEWEYYSLVVKRMLRGHSFKTEKGVVIFFTDITETYQLEESLKEKMQLLDLSFDAIQIQDEENKIFYWNKGSEKLYGWKEEEVIGKAAYKVLHTEFPTAYETFIKNLQKKKYWRGTLSQITKDNKRITVRSSWSLVEKNGKKHIIEINRDITEEAKLRNDLALREQRFRSLIENSSDGILITNTDLSIQYISPSIKRILGFNPEKIINLQLRQFFDDSDFSRIVQNHKRLLNGEKDITAIYKIKNKFGHIRYIESKSNNLLGDSAINGIVSNFRDITDAKITEQKLEERERRFKALIENSSDVVIITNAHGKITYVSPSIYNIFGYTQDEILRSTVKKFFHPDDFPKTMENLKKLLNGHVIQTNGQYRLKNKAGEWRWIETRATNLLNDPAVQGIVSNFRDITDEKNYASEIGSKNKKITEILENFQYAYYAIDKNWNYVYVNHEAVKLARMKKEDMIGKNVWELFPGIQDLESGKAMIRVMSNRIEEEYDVYFPPFNQWFHHYLYPTEEGIALYASDITQRKLIEQELEHTKKELESILKNIPNGIIVQNSKGEVVYVNDQAVKLTGYTSANDMLHSIKSDYLYHVDLQDEYGKKFPLENFPVRKALKTGQATHSTMKLIHKQTGEEQWVTITSNFITGHTKNPLLVTVLEDVTGFKEEDVRKNDFISMASHELKTPLTSLKVYMHLLLEGKNQDNKNEYIVKASDQLEKLEQLVSELLDQSTIQQGKLSLHLEEIYFDYFIKEYLKNFQQTTDGFAFQLTGETKSFVNVDRYRIEQVLANLLSNAMKYSTGRKKIMVTISKKDSAVALSVKDFGIGIPHSEIKNVFKPYYRVIGKNENTFPGMGMGLYISKNIIEKHGGKILVESKLSKGTTFTFSLPILSN